MEPSAKRAKVAADSIEGGARASTSNDPILDVIDAPTLTRAALAKCLEAGQSMQECKEAGYPLSSFSESTLQELAQAGFGPQECLESTGCDPIDLLQCKIGDGGELVFKDAAKL